MITRGIGCLGGFGLLVDPLLSGLGEAGQLRFVEPQSNLMLGGIHCIRAVTDVPANVDTEVSSDGAWLGCEWVGLSQHLAAHLHHLFTFPHHGDNWSGRHVVDESIEEGLGRQISVMLLQMLLAGRESFDADQFVASLFEPLDDLADQSTVDAIRLDHDEGAFPWLSHIFG